MGCTKATMWQVLAGVASNSSQPPRGGISIECERGEQRRVFALPAAAWEAGLKHRQAVKAGLKGCFGLKG